MHASPQLALLLVRAVGLFLARESDTLLSLDAWRSPVRAESHDSAGY